MFGNAKAKVNPIGSKTQISGKSMTGPVSKQYSGGATVAAGRGKGRKTSGK